MQLFVFKGFEQLGFIDGYSAVEWIRRYNVAGEFTITLPFNQEAFDLLSPGNIVYKSPTDEAGVITVRKIVRNSSAGQTLIVSGESVESLLKYRICSITKTADLKTIIADVLNSNFINPSNANRAVSGFRLLDYDIGTISADVDYANKDAYVIVTELAARYGVGFRIKFDWRTKSFGFYMFKGKYTDVIFEPQLGNVLEQDYWYTESEEKTTVFVSGGIVVGDGMKDLERKEGYLSAASGTGAATPTAQSENFLRERRPSQSFDAVIDTLSKQSTYRKDWDLGDIVRCRNREWGIDINRNILEITEYYDLNDFNLSVVFGDFITFGRR